MESLLPLVLLLALTSITGIIYRAKKGDIKKGKRLQILESEIGARYGKRASILQFSTTFCSECRTSKAIVKDVVKELTDISYIELDAESNLDLVRRVDIRSTPTTIFLDKNGYEIARAKGAPKRDQLIKAIQAL
jgi:thioredoxin-related protein